MFLGVTATVGNWDAEGTTCSLILEDNPLVDFVELPDTCQGLYYGNILSGVIRGALEMVSFTLLQHLLIINVFLCTIYVLCDRRRKLLQMQTCARPDLLSSYSRRDQSPVLPTGMATSVQMKGCFSHMEIYGVLLRFFPFAFLIHRLFHIILNSDEFSFSNVAVSLIIYLK